MLKDPASYIPPGKYPIIHQAAARRLRRARRPQGRPHRRSRPGASFDPKVLLCKGADGPVVPDRAAGGSGEEDLFAAVNPRTGQELFCVAGAGNRTGLGRSGPGSGTVGQHLRPVPIRRLQGSELGLEDVQLRQRRGARRPAGKPGHERHRSEHEAVLLARREAAALSRLERPQCADR